MSYPKKRINTELKELAKRFDLTTFAAILVGPDKDAIRYVAEIIKDIAPTTSSEILYKNRPKVARTISHNMKIYNEIIPKLVEDGKKE